LAENMSLLLIFWILIMSINFPPFSSLPASLSLPRFYGSIIPAFSKSFVCFPKSNCCYVRKILVFFNGTALFNYTTIVFYVLDHQSACTSPSSNRNLFFLLPTSSHSSMSFFFHSIMFVCE
jgi:hypothetical protein